MTAPGVEGVLAEVLAGHADCTLNDGQDLGAYATGMDVWSCGIVLSFGDDLEEAERAHVAQALLPVLADVWDEGHRDVCTDCNCRPESNPYRSAS